MKNLNEMTREELRATIRAFAIQAAVKAYQKNNPGCAESSAWTWASRNWPQYEEIGENCVVAIEVHREKKAASNN